MWQVNKLDSYDKNAGKHFNIKSVAIKYDAWHHYEMCVPVVSQSDLWQSYLVEWWWLEGKDCSSVCLNSREHFRAATV